MGHAAVVDLHNIGIWPQDNARRALQIEVESAEDFGIRIGVEQEHRLPVLGGVLSTDLEDHSALHPDKAKALECPPAGVFRIGKAGPDRGVPGDMSQYLLGAHEQLGLLVLGLVGRRCRDIRRGRIFEAGKAAVVVSAVRQVHW